MGLSLNIIIDVPDGCKLFKTIPITVKSNETNSL